MNPVQEYLTVIRDAFGNMTRPDDWEYRGVDDFVLRHGRSFEPSKKYDTIERGEMKQCYENASKLAMSSDAFTYVEGYANVMIPVPHAWCVDDKDVVIDPTWEDSTKCQYFGVPFTDIYLRRRMLQTEVWGVFWSEGGGEMINLELMRGKFVPMDVLQ